MSGVEALPSSPLKAKNGLQTVIAGSLAYLGISLGAMNDAPNRTGFYADLTPSGEALHMVVAGVDRGFIKQNEFDANGVKLRKIAVSSSLLIGENNDVTGTGATGAVLLGKDLVLASNYTGGTTPSVVVGASISVTVATSGSVFMGRGYTVGNSQSSNAIVIALGGTFGAISESVVIGRPDSTGSSSVIVGRQARGGNDAVSMGRQANAGHGGTALGRSASTSGRSDSVALGRSAVATANNQIMLGRAAEHVAIPGTGAASDTTSGALRITGGVGVGGAIHSGSSVVAGSAQYDGALTSQGGVRAGFGLPVVTSGSTSSPAMILTQGDTYVSPPLVNTFTAIVVRDGVSSSSIGEHHTAFVGFSRPNNTSGSRARVSGISGITDADAGAPGRRHHITGGYFLARQQNQNQDGFATGVYSAVSLANFQANAVDGPVRAIGGEFVVAISRASGNNNQEIYGVRSATSVILSDAARILPANYGGYFEATATITGAGSEITNYGIYATASGGTINYAGYFDGHTYVNGKLTVTGLIDPTGLQFDPVEANPGTANTLWVDSENSDKLMFGATPVIGGGGGGGIGGTIAVGQVAYGSGADTITGHGFLTYDGSTLSISLTDENAGVVKTALNIETSVMEGPVHGIHSVVQAGGGEAVGIFASASGGLTNYAAIFGGQVLALSGSNDYPAYSFVGNDNTGLSRAGTDSVAVICGGVQVLRLDDSPPSAVASDLVRIGVGVVRSGTGLVTDGTTPSTSTTTGALRVAGGAGIVGRVNAGSFFVNQTSVAGSYVLNIQSVATAGACFAGLITATGDGGENNHDVYAMSMSATATNGDTDSKSVAVYGISRVDNAGTAIAGEFVVRPNTGTVGYGINAKVDSGWAGTGYSALLEGDAILKGIGTAQEAWFYLGNPSENGSWRFGRVGDNLVNQRREGGIWVTKMTVEA